MQYEAKWLNALKGLAVIVIYMGYVGGELTTGYIFITTHYIPLLFFVLGIAENFCYEEDIFNYLISKVKTVLIPCYVMASLVVIMITIQYDCGWDTIANMTVFMARGIVRNTFVADSLWYLTCLFSMQMMFYVIKKVRYKWIVFGICLGLHYANTIMMNSADYSRWCFNVDGALYYMIFYALGYLSFPYVQKLLELNTRKKGLLFAITGSASLAYSALLYFGIDVLSFIVPSFAWRFVFWLKASLIMWSYVVCARGLQNVKFLAIIGENILYLCGSMYLLKVLISTVVSILGRSMIMIVPLRAYMYIGVLLFVGIRYLVPIEKYLVGKIVKKV